jgi:hypothetical protein
VKSKKVYFAKTGFVLAALALAGCMAAVKGEDNSVIRERAIQRWDYLIAHQADKAYDLLSPGYRETKPREDYAREMNSRGVRWSKASFGSQECEADVCHVHLAVDYQIKLGATGPAKSTGFLNETWVRANGKWYFLPEQVQPRLGKDKES